MIWEEMSYNKYQQLSMAQRLKEEYEPDFIYIYFEITEEEINEFEKTDISLFY